MSVRDNIKKAKRVVIKVGSSSITHEETGNISLRKLEKFVREVSDLKNSGKEVVVVTSGAVAVGRGTLNLTEKPKVLEVKQAVAAVGQASLMMLYQKIFREYNHQVGQILITKTVTNHEDRYNNAINTMNTLLDMGVIPIVNENDTLSTEEIEFGDNDRLSAVVATMIRADLLIILSDIDGLFDKDPRENEDAKVVHTVKEVTDEITNMAGTSSSKVGTGGMASKLIAANMANANGIDMVIANANKPYIIERINEGEEIGTVFLH